MDVLPAPFAVRPNETTGLQPDVLVGRDEDFTDKDLPLPPLLVVEVMSPSSKLVDRNLKKAAYERMGVPSLDPRKVSLTVFELDSTTFHYQQVAEVVGDKAFEATQPFAVRVVPSELLDGLSPESD